MEDHHQVDHVLRPTRVVLPAGSGRVVSVSAGYAHTVLRDDRGLVYTLGQNENGQLGLGAGAADIASAGVAQQVSGERDS